MARQPNDVPHLAFPIRFTGPGGYYATDDQDTNSEVTTCVRNICAFERGTRIERPDFGIADPTLKVMPIDVDDIANAISTWEPRAEAEIETIIDLEGNETINIRVGMPDSETMR
jgi:phage baseplate assembly protein W